MCDVCRGKSVSKEIVDNRNKYVQLKGKFMLIKQYNTEHKPMVAVGINVAYCPFCGEKLV